MTKVTKVKFVAYVATSIDGRIAKDKKSSSKSWTSLEDWKFFQKSLVSFDAFVVGSNTFKIEPRLKNRNSIVFTSKVREPKKLGKITFFNPEHSNILTFLSKNKYKKVAILGGPRIYDFFLKHKMLDELFVTIEPYVFGNGVPMFAGVFKKYNFILQSVKKLNKKGTLLLKYKHAN